MTPLTSVILAMMIATLFQPVTTVPKFAQTVPRFEHIAEQLDAADRATMPAPKPATVRVQVNYQLQWPAGRPSTLDEEKSAIASLHKSLYEMASHECENLKIVTPGECRLSAITISNSSTSYGAPGSIPTAAAMATFEIQSQAPSSGSEPDH